MTARSSRVEIAAVALLCGALLAQGVVSARANGPTADEFAHHVANGYSYWVTRDFRMNPASPPLPRMLSSLPLLFTGVSAPLHHPSWAAGDSPEFARQFFYRSGADADTLLFLARMPILLLSACLGLAVYAWTRKRWGAVAGICALTLYVFCPDVVAHSSLATADLAVAVFFFATLAAFGAYLGDPRPRRLATVGVAAGLTFLSKFSALLLLPVLPLVALLSGKIRQVAPKRTMAFLCVTALTVWAGYAFEWKPLLENTPDPPKKAAVYRQVGGQTLLRFAESVPVPLSTFTSAVLSMSYTRSQGTNAFLMGEWSREGWWYYYFVALGIKHTPPFLLSLLAALLLWRRLKIDRITAAVLLVPVAVFFLLTLRDKAQAGTRYFLPLVPLACALGGAALARLGRSGFGPRLCAVTLLGWHAISCLWALPYPLTYFSPLVGGTANGHRWLRDSNLDWGQGIKELGRIVRERGYPEVVLQYPWPADPAYYGIRYRLPEPSEAQSPRAAVYALSIHSLDSTLWAKDRKPDAVAGGSIFIYDRRGEPS